MPAMVDRESSDRLIAGGYYVTMPSERPKHKPASLMPPRILSVSDCLATIFPSTWALSWANHTECERMEAMVAAGLPDAALQRAMSWVTAALDAGEFGWPNLFTSLDAARRFVAEFLPASDNAVILGIGLPERIRRSFLDTEKPDARTAPPGIYTMLSVGSDMACGGEYLGIELLGYEFSGQCHSWLCNELEVLVAERFGIRPNANGFLDAVDEAERAATAITKEELGEPVRWDPWHIIRYAR